jgi:hypothetical protein
LDGGWYVCKSVMYNDRCLVDYSIGWLDVPEWHKAGICFWRILKEVANLVCIAMDMLKWAILFVRCWLGDLELVCEVARAK